MATLPTSATPRYSRVVSASVTSAELLESDSLTAIQVLHQPDPVLGTDAHELLNGSVANSDTMSHQQGYGGSYELLDLPVHPADYVPVSSFRALQEWEGYVIEIGTDHFVARLLDITADSCFEEEEATIPLEEVSERDKNRMELGNLFRWVIGYERSVTGTKRRVSEIVFRDLPALTDADILEGKAWANRVISVLNL